MSRIAVLIFIALALACGKSEEAGNDEPKAEAKSEDPSEAPKPAAAPAPKGNDELAEVHAHLKAGKKIQAVKAYREMHGKLALNASKIGVEVEATKLGLPSLDRARTAFFEGKSDEEIGKLIEAVFKGSRGWDSSKLPEQLQRLKQVGPATVENLEAKIKAGQSTHALEIYHHLHPDEPIPEAWKKLSARMGK